MNEEKTFWACSIWHGWDNNWVGNMNGMKRKIIQFHENHAQNADCLNLVSNSWNFENSKKSNNTLDWWILEHWLGVDGEREREIVKMVFPFCTCMASDLRASTNKHAYCQCFGRLVWGLGKMGWNGRQLPVWCHHMCKLAQTKTI